MNKLSLVSIIIGLFFLGISFFFIGFLSALLNVNPPSLVQGPNTFEKAAIFVKDRLLSDQITHIQSKIGGGKINQVLTQLPISVQPFANHARNVLVLNTQQQVSKVSQAAIYQLFEKNAPRRRQILTPPLSSQVPSTTQEVTNKIPAPFSRKKLQFQEDPLPPEYRAESPIEVLEYLVKP